jgi:hypothetical protein
LFVLSLLSPPCNLWRERREKKILKTHRSFGDNTTNTVGKIWTRLIQRYQGRSPTVIEVHHKSRPKKNELWYICTSRVAYFGHCSWPFLVSLYFSCWYLSNDIGGVVIRVSACFQDFFISSLVFFFLLSFYCKLCPPIFNFGESLIWHLWLFKPFYFSKKFCTMLFYPFFLVLKYKNILFKWTRKIQRHDS